MPFGADMARRYPITAVAVVLTPGVNVPNAWAVLVEAFDELEALRLLRTAALANAVELTERCVDARESARAAVYAVLSVVAPHLAIPYAPAPAPSKEQP